MQKNILGFVISVLIVAPSFSAQAQQAKKISRIGYLSSGTPASDSARAEGIRLALRELGHIEGQNIAIEYRYAENRRERTLELAAELVRLKVDLIVAAGGDLVIRAAKNATMTIPIVLVGQGSDPVEAGFVESLARSGGNVTGLTLLNRELGGKRLELLNEVVPRLARVGVLYDPVLPGTAREVKEDLPVAASAMGVTLKLWEVRQADEVDGVFAAISRERPDGLYVPVAGEVMRGNEKRISRFALKSRIPLLFDTPRGVDAGGLMSYHADRADSYRRVAIYVDRILKGAKAEDLPVERPTKFELVINLKTAKQIGLTIPPNVLARANRVIR